MPLRNPLTAASSTSTSDPASLSASTTPSTSKARGFDPSTTQGIPRTESQAGRARWSGQGLKDAPKKITYEKRHLPIVHWSQRFSAKLPQPPGPWNVGCLDFELPARSPRSFGTYRSHVHRSERTSLPWAPSDPPQAGTTSLSLLTTAFTLFYPTHLTSSQSKDYYRPRWFHKPTWVYSQAFTQSFGLPRWGSWPFSGAVWVSVKGVRLNAVEGAPIISEQDGYERGEGFSTTRINRYGGERQGYPEKLPVIVFSHGLGGHPRFYSEICTAWASYGFVVCAVEHRDGTGAAVLIDPEKLPPPEAREFDKGNNRETVTIRHKRHKYLREKAIWIPPVSHAYSGKKAPNWLNPADETLTLRRGQLSMRVHEIEEAINVLHDLDEGKVGGKGLCYLRDKKSRFQGEGEMRRVVGMFRGRLDLIGNLIMAGHSAGGATTVEVLRAMNDPEMKTKENGRAIGDCPFKMGLLLDVWTSAIPPPHPSHLPPQFEAPAHPSALPDRHDLSTSRGWISVPLLNISSTMFAQWEDVSPYADAIIAESARHSGRSVSIEVEGSHHLNQSDVPAFMDRVLTGFTSLGVGSSKPDPTRCLDLNIKATLEFMRTILPELEELPLPRVGFESDLSIPLLRMMGVKRKYRKKMLENVGERVLGGDAPEVKVHFKQL